MRRIFLINGELFESKHVIVRHPSDGYRPCRRIQYVPLKLGRPAEEQPDAPMPLRDALREQVAQIKARHKATGWGR